MAGGQSCMESLAFVALACVAVMRVARDTAGWMGAGIVVREMGLVVGAVDGTNFQQRTVRLKVETVPDMGPGALGCGSG
eukprot:12334826-Prorocentrum_lima.AAC.1